MTNSSFFSFVLLLFITITQTTHANYNNNQYSGLSFRLIPRETLESPSYLSNLTIEQKTERLIYHSKVRYNSFESISRDNSSISLSLSQSTNELIRPRLYNQFGQSAFLVQVGIGSFVGSRLPSKTYYLGLDTGGGEIWTQCQGCNPCFRQRDPVFPMSQSRTYRALNCGQCPRGTICEQDHCRSVHSYQDGGRVEGIAATETFTLGSSTSGSFMTMQNIRFTCVIRSDNFVHARNANNIASGMFGMSPHSSSFMSQVGAYLGGRFSYCLIPTDYQRQRPPMFLRFGNDIPHLSLLDRRSTPLIRGRYAYNLDLRAISVGSETLNIDRSVFQLRQDGTGGCFIDSGASIGRLINIAYTEFETELTRQIFSRNPGISTSSRPPGKLCYKQPRPRTRTSFPKVTYHFANGADFVVEPQAYMLGFVHPQPQVYCLMIVPSDTFTVFGANQQVNHRIIYDTLNSELHFALLDCLSNN